MAKSEAKAEYSKPTSQLDLEERQQEDYVPPAVLAQGEDQPLSLNGYIGVDPIYQNYANPTEAPLPVEDGPEAVLFEEHLDDDVDFEAASVAESAGDDGPKSNEQLAAEKKSEESDSDSGAKKKPSATPSGSTKTSSTSAPSNS